MLENAKLKNKRHTSLILTDLAKMASLSMHFNLKHYAKHEHPGSSGFSRNLESTCHVTVPKKGHYYESMWQTEKKVNTSLLFLSPLDRLNINKSAVMVLAK